MEYYAYKQLIYNTLPYRDLDARVREGIKDIVRNKVRVLYLYDKGDMIEIDPCYMSYEAIECNPDNVYRIKSEDHEIDCIAYEIEANDVGFYTCNAVRHGIYDAKPYLNYLSHKDIIGVLYKGDDGLTYKSSVMSCVLGKEPLYLYMSYKM
jgi:hypothetical protein